MSESLLLNKLETLNNYMKNKYNADDSINYNNTLFILDWDDTLFPTHWVTKNGINIMNNNERDQYFEFFKDLDRNLSVFLKNIMKLGKVVIVTNALKEWVKISSIVIPKTYNILKNIEIISARSLFGGKTNDIMDWKKNTFKMVIENHYSNLQVMNVISIGDAEYEYQALVSLTKLNMDKIKYLKSFRLIKEPQYNHIIEQIGLLNNYIRNFWNVKSQICKSFKFNN